MTGLTTIRRSVNRLRHRLQHGAVVLLYHRVASLPSDPQALAVSPEHFDQHMRLLKERWTVLPLAELVARLEQGALPHRSIAITFDDGYADNLHAAAPVLERHQLPATVFVTSGAVGSHHEFFWDELDRLLLQPGKLPDHLEIELGGPREFERFLGKDAEYSQASFESNRRWTVLDDAEPTERHALYRTLCKLLRRMDAARQRGALERLATWAGAPLQGRLTHRTLTAAEVRLLASRPSIELGAHTVTHTELSILPTEEQQREIHESKTGLASMTGRAVRLFSYPFGSRAAYTAQTVAAVQEAGFGGACANIPGVVRVDTPAFELPRHLVRDVDGQTLASQLEAWFDE